MRSFLGLRQPDFSMPCAPSCSGRTLEGAPIACCRPRILPAHVRSPRHLAPTAAAYGPGGGSARWGSSSGGGGGEFEETSGSAAAGGSIVRRRTQQAQAPPDGSNNLRRAGRGSGGGSGKWEGRERGGAGGAAEGGGAAEEPQWRRTGRARRMLQARWYERPGIRVDELHAGILARCAQQQFGSSTAPSAAGGSPDSAPSSAAAGDGTSNAAAAAAAAAAAGGGEAFSAAAARRRDSAAAQKQAARALLPALVLLMRSAKRGSHADMAGDAIAAVRLALARQGLLAPFEQEVTAAFCEMAARCRASDLLLAALARPADYGIPLSKKAVHRILEIWEDSAEAEDAEILARRARRAERRAAAAAAAAAAAGGPDSLGVGFEEGVGAAAVQQQQQQGEEGQEGQEEEGGGSDWQVGANGDGASVWPDRRTLALERIEAVAAAMPAAGLPPDQKTSYILIRAAVNAGKFDRAVAAGEAYAAANPEGPPLKPSTERLLATARGELAAGSGSSNGGGGGKPAATKRVA